MNSLDLFFLSSINDFARRSIRFDEFVSWLSNSNLLKGGVVIGIVWWLWFRRADIRSTREALLAAIIASFPALAFARILSWFVNRPRPLVEMPDIFRVPYGEKPIWEGPSSFPSDHAVLFFALAAGVFFASRRAGWFVFAYVSVVICLPRLFLAVHYPTDILAGATIGIVMAWLANLAFIRKPLTTWLLRWQETNPGQFYCFSFILTYQMAELFDPIIGMLKAAKLIVQGPG
jgi:undecaprenyl-diphosphatase